MKTRFLLAACLSLITGSVFVAPEMVYFGLDSAMAAGLSRALLVAGIAAALLAIRAEAQEAKRHEK